MTTTRKPAADLTTDDVINFPDRLRVVAAPATRVNTMHGPRIHVLVAGDDKPLPFGLDDTVPVLTD